MKNTKNKSNDTLRKEYDFSKGIRGKYAYKLLEQDGFIKLESDIAIIFKNSHEVNTALRSIISSLPKRIVKVP